MIFVTVGTHEQQFNRLLKEIDNLKAIGIISEDVFIQRGYSRYIPRSCRSADFISYYDILENIRKARIVIMHAGPSSIMDCINNGKVPIVIPRQKRYKEHIDDHQVNFCKKIESIFPVSIIYDIKDLADRIERYDLLIKDIALRKEADSDREERINKCVETLENICREIVATG